MPIIGQVGGQAPGQFIGQTSGPIGAPASVGSPTSPSVQPLARIWQVGQILNALVLARQPGGQISLRIQDTEVQAQAPASLSVSPGQTLRLQVESTGDQPVLRVIQETSPQQVIAASLRAALPRQGAMTALLANLAVLEQAALPGLPRTLTELARQVLSQLPTPEMLSRPDGLTQAVTDSGLFLEAKLAQALTKGEPPAIATDLKAGFLRLLSTLRDVVQSPPSPQAEPLPLAARGGSPAPELPAPELPAPELPAVRSAALPDDGLPSLQSTTQPTSGEDSQAPAGRDIPPQIMARSSGDAPAPPPLRTTVPHAQPPVPASLPASLPVSSLEMSSPARAAMELSRQVESAVARIQISQTASLPSPDGSAFWVLELPVRQQHGSGVVQLRIERDRQAAHGAQPTPWSVWLALDLNGLGPVRAHVVARADTISATFWAEHETTAQLFNGCLDELQCRLTQAGLHPGALGCRSGIPPRPDALDTFDAIGATPLLDETA